MRPKGSPYVPSFPEWIPDYMMFTPEIPYTDPLRMELLKLQRKMLQAETGYGEYKDMKYEDARDQMNDFLDKNRLTYNIEDRAFFHKEMTKSNAKLAESYITNKDARLINELSPRLYKDERIIGILLKYPHVSKYITFDTPEKTELKKAVEKRVPLAQVHKGNPAGTRRNDDIGNLGTDNWRRIESYLGGKNKSKRYAKNTQSRRRKVPRSRKMLSRT